MRFLGSISLLFSTKFEQKFEQFLNRFEWNSMILDKVETSHFDCIWVKCVSIEYCKQTIVSFISTEEEEGESVTLSSAKQFF